MRRGREWHAFFKGNAEDSSSLEGLLPQAWNSNLRIVPGESFNMGDAIQGNVASWQAGDFGYDIASPYIDALIKSNLSSEQLKQAAQPARHLGDHSRLLQYPRLSAF